MAASAPANCAPPPIGRRPSRRRYAFWLGGFVLAILGLHLATAWHLPLPVCLLRKFTGIPCPFCGSTRSLAALAHGEIAAALGWNPLTFFAGVAAVASCTLGLIQPEWPTRSWGIVRERLVARVWLIALAVIAANWLYLLLNLPR
jgi:hypothetical protein